uniref:Ubiquitin carboxyl-terminal hydrolase n=1 Tax=Romanomermis culicivorax TaxID=13658 RepID=A0A915L016_ROMCU
MAAAGNWCLIESDPGVFTELIRQFGCSGVQVEELYSLEPSCFQELKPIHGLIFLFKCLAGEEPSSNVVNDSRLQEIYFAQQVIQNACASQAIINLLLNCEHPEVKLGPVLSEFKSFTANFDPSSRGLALSNAEKIRKVHNSFSRQQIFEIEDVKIPEKEDNFHFIAYVPVKGYVYELDGLQNGPIDLGKISDGADWIEVVRPEIEKRIQRYIAGEIHFNLMAVISDRKQKYKARLAEISSMNNNEQYAAEVCHLEALINEEETKDKQHKLLECKDFNIIGKGCGRKEKEKSGKEDVAIETAVMAERFELLAIGLFRSVEKDNMIGFRKSVLVEKDDWDRMDDFAG